MQNPVQNSLNKFFDNINYDLASYNEVITKSRLESAFGKILILIFIYSIASCVLFYTLNSGSFALKKLPRDLDQLMLGGNRAKRQTLKKVVTLKCCGRKVKQLPAIYQNFKYTKVDHLIHSIYYVFYAAIYGVAIYLFVVGVV